MKCKKIRHSVCKHFPGYTGKVVISSKVQVDFVKQEREEYCLPACVQMIVGKRMSQQDIYFRAIKIGHLVAESEAKRKTLYSNKNSIITWREHECAMLERLVNNLAIGKNWKIVISTRPFHKFPAFVHMRNKGRGNPGHMVVVTGTDGIRATIFDPMEDGPVEVSVKNISSFVLAYYDLICL